MKIELCCDTMKSLIVNRVMTIQVKGLGEVALAFVTDEGSIEADYCPGCQKKIEIEVTTPGHTITIQIPPGKILDEEAMAKQIGESLRELIIESTDTRKVYYEPAAGKYHILDESDSIPALWLKSHHIKPEDVDPMTGELK